jgi:glutamine synthetase adenylyltransferase
MEHDVQHFRKQLGPAVHRGPEALAELFEKDPAAVSKLAGLFSTESHRLAQNLSRDPRLLAQLLTGIGA